MCLGYSQYFSAFIDTVSTQTLNAIANIQPETTSFPLFPQKDPLPDLSTKHTHDLNAALAHTSCSQSSTPFIAPTKNNLETNTSTDTLDHPMKWTCLAKSADEYNNSNSLVSRIGERTL